MSTTSTMGVMRAGVSSKTTDRQPGPGARPGDDAPPEGMPRWPPGVRHQPAGLPWWPVGCSTVGAWGRRRNIRAQPPSNAPEPGDRSAGLTFAPPWGCCGAVAATPTWREPGDGQLWKGCQTPDGPGTLALVNQAAGQVSRERMGSWGDVAGGAPAGDPWRKGDDRVRLRPRALHPEHGASPLSGLARTPHEHGRRGPGAGHHRTAGHRQGGLRQLSSAGPPLWSASPRAGRRARLVGGSGCPWLGIDSVLGVAASRRRTARGRTPSCGRCSTGRLSTPSWGSTQPQPASGWPASAGSGCGPRPRWPTVPSATRTR